MVGCNSPLNVILTNQMIQVRIKDNRHVMNMKKQILLKNILAQGSSITFALLLVIFISACSEGSDIETPTENTPVDAAGNEAGDNAIDATFHGSIDLTNLANYANQDVPQYITKDNAPDNPVDDREATLGRALFYDNNLSSNRTISCASCHQQAFAFSDNEALSQGVNGVTGRHSMRLINVRFADEENFFWDERAIDLEDQTTRPIQDHIEMGFSGTNGDGDINDLIDRLSALDYYQELFTFAYGDPLITEERMQSALSDFIRSIQSFDSRFDQGLVQANNVNRDFPNFTNQENLGKRLFLSRPQINGGIRVGGGAGCGGCHRAPEFDIDPNSRNNGVITAASTGEIDLTNTRSPTLRDVFDIDGQLNGQMMHNGAFETMEGVMAHYNNVPNNQQLDNRLRNGGMGQNLNLTNDEIQAIIAFMKTLSGNDIYTNEKWSDPFN